MSVVPLHRPELDQRRSSLLGLGAREWAAYLSFAAALAHAILIRETFAEWWEAGVFFVVLTVVEAAIGIALFKRFRLAEVSLLGVLFNLGTVLTYLVSRVWGFDFAPDRGPHGTDTGPGRPVLPYTVELVGKFDYFVLLVEVATIVLLLGFLPAAWRRWCTNGLVLAAVIVGGAAFLTT